MHAKIADVKRHLKAEAIDGWLLYDFHGLNPLSVEFLSFPENISRTRRFFYWIPKEGDPIKIVHAIEPHVLDHLPGNSIVYLSRKSLEDALAAVLKGKGRVAMEYSKRGHVPSVSKVDKGTIDLVEDLGCKVVSSSSFLQYFTCIWEDYQFELHLEAAQVLEETVAKAWEWIAEALVNGEKITEYDVQERILEEFENLGFEMEGAPHCCTNEHAADPHYSAHPLHSSIIKKGDFILIDLWCKKKTKGAVFADITRVGVAASSPTKRQQEIFNIVRKAQKEAILFLQDRLAKKEKVLGYEVDMVVREVIEKAGYGKFFIHRTGHNIHTNVHGPGAHLDSLETYDDRPLLPRTCFSVEPGIYLPGEFGVRLEHDVYLTEEGDVVVTGGEQEEIVTLL